MYALEMAIVRVQIPVYVRMDTVEHNAKPFVNAIVLILIIRLCAMQMEHVTLKIIVLVILVTREISVVYQYALELMHLDMMYALAMDNVFLQIHASVITIELVLTVTPPSVVQKVQLIQQYVLDMEIVLELLMVGNVFVM
jgi:hypothetical protein